MSEQPSSNECVSIPEATALKRKLREGHAASGAAWAFEDWLTIRYEELRRRFERACGRITELESAAFEPCNGQCEICHKSLPPVSEWSMPTCPDCQHVLESLGEIMADFVDRNQTIKADMIGNAINLICARPVLPPKTIPGYTTDDDLLKIAYGYAAGSQFDRIAILKMLRHFEEVWRLGPAKGENHG